MAFRAGVQAKVGTAHSLRPLFPSVHLLSLSGEQGYLEDVEGRWGLGVPRGRKAPFHSPPLPNRVCRQMSF